MSDRARYYFRQRISEAELNLAFELLEKADRNLAADLGIYGVISGAVPAPHSPVPNLCVDLTAPGRAYDKLGQRLFFGTGQTVDCAVDLVGIPTDVASASNERWLGLFLRFKRQLSDPRTDGNSQQVFFRQDESFEVVVRQAPEGAIGAAPRAALQPEELLLCDVRRTRAQTQILAADLDTSRRQAFIFAQGTSVAVTTGAWSILAPLAGTAQASFDEVDAELREHFTAASRRHAAAAVDYTPHGTIAAGTVQAALDEVVDDLAKATTGAAGAALVGADAASGTPNALVSGTVDGQLSTLLGFINAHATAATSAHSASAIAATAHNNVSATNVQAQLQEIVTDLGATGASAPGAGLVGVDAIAGTPVSLAAGTVRAALAGILGQFNVHLDDVDAHLASAIHVPTSTLMESGDVGAALTEIVAALGENHFRGNQTNGGLHRAIVQPNLGGTKALLWDSLGNGGPSARLRVYADADFIWFTVNAAWNGSAWARDSTSYYSGGFRFSRYGFEVLQDTTVTATFANWSRSMRLTMGTSGFEMSGPVQENGFCGVKLWNPLTTAANFTAGASVTFRNRFPTAPSSVTLVPRTLSSIYASVDMSTRDGFAFTVQTNSLPSATASAWWGDYTAIG
jgi:hypothetical protein